MDTNTFDDLVRDAFSGASRRGVVRAGLAGLAISAMTAIGLNAKTAEAKKKKKKRKKKKKTPVAICPADLPLVCGDGCCPNAYPKCCLANFGFSGGGLVMVAADAPGESTCNPTSFNCCPADQGGGSCGGFHSVCCNATLQQPFGDCVQAGGSCCTTEQGGGHCDAEAPVCCPEDPTDPFRGGYCCLSGETCCQQDADCPGGGVGSCDNGCCAAAPREAGRSRSRTRQGTGERFHLAAR